MWRIMDPANRSRVMIGLAVLSLVVLTAGLLTAIRWDNQRGKTGHPEAASNTTVVTVSGVFDPNDPANKSIPTVTLTIPPTTQSTIPTPASIPPNIHAESSNPDASQLAQVCNQQTSGLQPSTYAQVTATATALLKARTTGEGAANFSDYLNKSFPLWQMSQLNVIYTCVETSSDPSYLKTVIWWGGTKSIGGQIGEARTGVYLAPGTLTPVSDKDLPNNLESDPDVSTVLMDAPSDQ